MTTETIGRLSDEDLARFRSIFIRKQGYEIRPDAYSREEIEQNEMSMIRFCGEIGQRYDIDDSRTWSISSYMGVISYEPEG